MGKRSADGDVPSRRDTVKDLEGSSLAARRSRPADGALQACVDAVRRYCRSRTQSEVDAEDAAQDAFLRFIERAGDDVRNVEAWLIQAASFECKDLYRRRLREQQLLPAGVPPAAEAVVADPEALVGQRMLVESLFTRLQPNDRELLTLRYLADFSVEQVASRLRVSEGNARIMALRARRRARDVLSALEKGIASAVLVVPSAGRALYSRLHARLTDTGRRLVGMAQSVSTQSTWAQVATLAPLVPVLAVAALAHDPSAGLTPRVAPAATAASNTTAAGLPDRVRLARPAPNGSNGVQAPSHTTPGNRSSGGSVSGGPVPALINVVSPAQNANQEDVGFSAMTVSPDYQQDRTVFASGTDAHNCTSLCQVLFVSHDGGGSWHPQPTVGFQGGRLLLPPAFPADPTLFAVGEGGLARSDGGTGQFHVVAPGTTSAAMDPASAPGASHLLLGTVPLTFYDAGSGLVSPGPTLPPGVTTVTDVAFLGTSSEVAVAAQQVDAMAPGQQDGVLLRCSLQACQVSSAFPGQLGFRLVASPAVAADHTLAAIRGATVVISYDDAGSFVTALAPADGVLSAVAFGARATTGGDVIVGGWVGSPSARQPLLLASADGGHSFQRLSGEGLAGYLDFASMAMLPDGHLLGALSVPDGVGDFGIRCSADGGLRWRSAC